MSTLWFNIISALFDIAVFAVLIFAAKDDSKTRIVRPSIQLTLLGVAVAHFLFVLAASLFLNVQGVTLGYALQFPLAGALMFVIYITLVLIFKTGIGGADTKVSSIMALHLGLANGALLVFTHFIAAMIYAAYMSIVKHKRIASVPLMVFIAIGFAITMIIKWSAILL
jgi:hypothetical protein